MSYGMVPKIGVVRYSDNDLKELAPETRKMIDDCVKELLEDSYDRAKRCLEKHSSDHEKLAKALLELETLTGAEIRTYLKRGKLPVRS